MNISRSNYRHFSRPRRHQYRWDVSLGVLILRGGQSQCRYGNRHLPGRARVTRRSEYVVWRRTIEPWGLEESCKPHGRASRGALRNYSAQHGNGANLTERRRIAFLTECNKPAAQKPRSACGGGATVKGKAYESNDGEGSSTCDKGITGIK